MTIKILNYYEAPVKLHVDISKTEFQISSLIDGVEQLDSSKELILPVSSSDDDIFHIRVAYEPRKVGFVQTRLKGQCLERNITFRVCLFNIFIAHLIKFINVYFLPSLEII